MRVYAFLNENDPEGIVKWVVSPGQDVDGCTKLKYGHTLLPNIGVDTNTDFQR